MPSRRYLTWSSIAVLVVIGSFVAGVKFGEHFEHQRFELMKDLSVVQADESLSKGDFGRAIAVLHFTKSFERIRGGSDAMLAKAYLGNDEPCLAQAFADSHLRYMERNTLTSLSSYASTLDLYERASKQCAGVSRTSAASAAK